MLLACFACLRACVLKCLACLHAYVLACLACLRAYVLGVLACLRACVLGVLGVLTCFRAWRAFVLTCLVGLRAWRAWCAWWACLLACFHAWRACLCACLLWWNVLFSYVSAYLVCFFCVTCFTFKSKNSYSKKFVCFVKLNIFLFTFWYQLVKQFEINLREVGKPIDISYSRSCSKAISIFNSLLLFDQLSVKLLTVLTFQYHDIPCCMNEMLFICIYLLKVELL